MVLPRASDPSGPETHAEDETVTRLASVVGALSYALDLTEGQPAGHSVRTTLIGMRLAAELGLDELARSELFYGLLLKDLGCSSNASRLAGLFGSDDHLLKHAHKLTDWTATSEAARYAYKHSLPGGSRLARAWHALMLGTRAKEIGREMIATRCERGADIAAMLGLPAGSAAAIRGLDEHWDGNGMPFGLVGTATPILARIAGLSQTVEVFARSFDVRTAYEMARARQGRWFDPVLVEALGAFEFDAAFWADLRGANSLVALADVEPRDRLVHADERQLDQIAEGFARVIDAKSPFTSTHSQNVAFLSSRTAAEMGLAHGEIRTIRRAALLHDIGKLGVSNRILDKPAALDPVEFQLMQQHTRYTFEILSQVSRFRTFAATAAAHHERLDGSGYHLGLRGEELGTAARILAVADCTEAMMADRPYRAGLGLEETVDRLRKLAARGHLCASATEALTGWFKALPNASSPAPAAQASGPMAA
ncbi:MAG TPA: HD domain-containing phosphohydrolase [Gemmatimonadales bacterium]|nr:HD domain-containing phosphohydrolase [Gemmatimonadales bacterium]